MKCRLFVAWLAALLFSETALAASEVKTSPLPQGPEPADVATLSPAAKAAAEAGLAAFIKGDLEVARRQFQNLLLLAPDNLTGLVNLGSIEYRLHHAEEAEKFLKRAVRINPEAGLAWLTLGVIYNKQDKPDAALAALSEAVLLEPKNARAHNALADTLWRKGWYSGAEDELQQTIELEPSFADAHFNLAMAYLRHTPPAVELARRHYERACELGAARDQAIEKQLANDPR